MVKEFIEREAAIEAIMSEPPDAHYPQWYVDKIKSIPAANVAGVRHGQKLRPRRRSSKCCCDDSTCNGGVIRNTNQRYPNGLYPICPHCGAKLDIKRCLRRNSDDANIRRYY